MRSVRPRARAQHPELLCVHPFTMADLQEQLESLVHEVAAYHAHSKGIAAAKRVGVFRVSCLA